MQLNTTNVLLVLLGITLILCFILMLMDKKYENFDPVIDAIQSQLQSETPEQLKSTIQTLQQRLIDYGYAPDLKNYVKKTDLGANGGQCNVSNAVDRDKYISKTDIPSPGPRIDLSQYVKKSSIPPAPVCPPTPTVDLTAYVKKSTLPPNEKCPPCIAPKVKVSAGLCRECPPAPPCPAPEPCPACNCPPPAPCPPQKECTKCDEVRYIKVPAIITKTVTVDKNGNIISQKIDSGSTNPTTTTASTTASSTTSPITTTTQALTPSTTTANSSTSSILLNSIFGSSAVMNNALGTTSTMSLQNLSQSTQPQATQSLLNMQQMQQMQQMPSTTFPAMSSTHNTTLAQTLDGGNGATTAFCPSSDLNSNFKSWGGVTGRNESNFIM